MITQERLGDVETIYKEDDRWPDVMTNADGDSLFSISPLESAWSSPQMSDHQAHLPYLSHGKDRQGAHFEWISTRIGTNSAGDSKARRPLTTSASGKAKCRVVMV